MTPTIENLVSEILDGIPQFVYLCREEYDLLDPDTPERTTMETDTIYPVTHLLTQSPRLTLRIGRDRIGVLREGSPFRRVIAYPDRAEVWYVDE